MGTSIFGHREFILQQDHPHAYGDKILFLQQRKSPIGSSPRVWGQVQRKCLTEAITQIIPTRMGTSPYMPLPLQVAGDHPHAYGDKFRKFYNQTPSTGSSPRVWGQDIWQFSINGTVRIIPTRMGTSTAKDLFNASSRDHPHAYGDKELNLKWDFGLIGSSPRVWGQVIT